MEKGNIVIYKEKSGIAKIKVKLEEETVWLSQKQMAKLFDKNLKTISEHVQNIYKEKELKRGSTVRKFRIVRKEGKREVARDIDFYNLDVIISVGYRVKSKQGTNFRIWATNILKQHIIKGITVNNRRLKQARAIRLSELERTTSFLKDIINKKKLEGDEMLGLLNVITDYANTWTLLERYDQKTLSIDEEKQQKAILFSYQEVETLIQELKNNLVKKKQASRFFGLEKDNGLDGILGNLDQEIAGAPVYKSKAEKAANLLYLVIKDRIFIDGNKRIASFLFILFLRRNNLLYNKKGEKVINDTALVALALMVAESKTQDKDIMINLIVNLLNK